MMEVKDNMGEIFHAKAQRRTGRTLVVLYSVGFAMTNLKPTPVGAARYIELRNLAVRESMST